jgi:heme-degrading monooxygenase HmoA
VRRANQAPPSSPVTLINVFEVPASRVDAFIANWRNRAVLLTSKPGLLDSRLHRALSDQARFQLINVAHWESHDAFHMATEDTEFQQRTAAAASDSERLVSASPAHYELALELSRPAADVDH